MTALSADHVVAALRAAFAHEVKRSELLQLAATKIQAVGQPYTSVYLYMVEGDDLVLEAYAGRATELTRIPVGQGVCGTAAATGIDQNIGDVSQSSEYLSCSTETASELVVLIRRGKTILGQIDIDSDYPDPFTADEEAAVRRVADALAVLL
ncbi:MAG: GAF domain-containing protein [Gemmatimonadales bacterium]|nr:GAF domain-containing protein [Gemmatimonadales bacterium]